ncbi:SRPBCC family protein [uncultured Kordia sp.]|uniref:SRPBCC family protein n=1 Tax=uncultured Kordia sp. TaxID=507699 RepID=UPI002628A808|nr:SRPBCC family protein [uncultured Kordia sp.]
MKTIKSILLTIALTFVGGLNTVVMAQKEQRFTEITSDKTSQTMNVSQDSLWKIISSPDLSRWSTLLDSTFVFGEEKFDGVNWSSRVSQVNSRGHHESHESLIDYNNAERKIKFASTEFPGFIISNETEWRVIDKGENKSALRIVVRMRMKKFHAAFLKRPMLKAINNNAEGVFYDIRFFAETGFISPTKHRRMEILLEEEKPRRYKEIKRHLSSEIINVSADSLWAICRQFDRTAEWTSTLNHSYGTDNPKFEGATCNERTCETNIGGGSTVKEELILFSDKNKELSYNLTEGAPDFVLHVNNHWRIIEIGLNQSRIEMNVTMHLKPFAGFFLGCVITKQMTKQVSIVLEELKIYAETGKVSEAKKRQVEKKKK